MVWSIKALETMRTGQIYIVFVCESGGTQMGSLCMVLPGCSLTDYFVPSRLVKRRVVKSRSGMNRDAAFFISGTSGWRCCNNSGVKNTYHCSSPIAGTINVFLRRCPWALFG